MTARTDPFGPLRLPAAVLAGALALAGIAVYAGGRFLGAAEDDHSSLQHQLTEADIRLQRLRNQEASFRSDAEAYRRLEAQGLRGPEQRLAWVRLMDALPREVGVSRADFQLAAQRPYAVLPTDGGSSLHLGASSVTLHLEAVHEGRVLSFLDRLQARTPGLLVLRSCQLDGVDGPVRADCRLDWITLDP